MTLISPHLQQLPAQLYKGFQWLLLSLHQKQLIDPAKLSEIKLKTNRMELLFAKSTRARKRTVNIDPGYINDAKLVLASTKDYNHRLYILKGIYQEVTLTFQSGSFRFFDWTYPDYRTDDYIAIFNHIRELFMNQRNI